VLIVDDDERYRRVAHDVAVVTGCEIVGEASTGEEAVSLAEMLQPDLVLMDVRMPGAGGIEAARRLAELTPDVRVVLLSADVSLPDGSTPAGVVGPLRKERLRPSMLRELLAR
jgi:YesN/AraC family two-component response regulator